MHKSSFRTPVLRSLPGFRTHTLWKELTALGFYLFLLPFAEACLLTSGIPGLIEVFTFYVIIPLITIFNMGNLLRFVPVRLRQNNRLFSMVRVAVTLASIFVPMVIDNLIPGA
ncbi:MAG: hypothetical protein IJ468_14270 [Lachnospiraceae bacterium]|nr:hypothetical protein [Lachnospiraceae bacterium]